jgi:predicted amidohydrolase YtcJ
MKNCSIFGREDADAIGIKNGEISLIGKDPEEQSKHTRDLGGSWVLPGFVDGHTHLLTLGLEHLRTSLTATRSKVEAIELLKKATHTRRLVVAYKWDESKWKEKDYLRKGDLDFTSSPVVAYRRDGHMATLNTAALRIVHREDANDGILKESDLKLLEPLVEPDWAERLEALRIAFNVALREGVTAVRDNVNRDTLQAYDALEKPLTVVRMIFSDELYADYQQSPENWGVKTFLDGSIGSSTAAHLGWPGQNLRANKEEFQALCQRLWGMGIPVAAHAIGELATSVAVKTFALSSRTNSIEHFELVEEETLDQLNASTTLLSCQPNFLEWALPGGMYEERLGTEWLERNNNYRDFLKRGFKLGFGSDTMPLGPMYGIHYAVNSPYPRQRLSLEEAVTCYTSGSARLLGLDDTLGRIEVGLNADFAVFPPDLPDQVSSLKEIKPIATIVHGKVAYARPGGVLRLDRQ